MDASHCGSEHLSVTGRKGYGAKKSNRSGQRARRQAGSAPFMSLHLITGLLVLSLLGTPARLSAAVIEIAPRPASHCHEQLEKVANTLKPGDELILHGGTYSQS